MRTSSVARNPAASVNSAVYTVPPPMIGRSSELNAPNTRIAMTTMLTAPMTTGLRELNDRPVGDLRVFMPVIRRTDSRRW